MTAAAPTAAAEPAKAKTDAKPTEYVVLLKTKKASETATTGDLGREAWERVGGIYQGTAEQAIRKAASLAGSDRYTDGTYVAIPARSFKPVTLTTSTETKVTLS